LGSVAKTEKLGDSPRLTGTTGASASLKLEFISSQCGNGTCPTLYRTNRDTLVIQGYAVEAEHAGVAVPEGELLVEIPVELLKNFLQQHGP
jgi:hypothetical protein